jgi:hypothetical protein
MGGTEALIGMIVSTVGSTVSGMAAAKAEGRAAEQSAQFNAQAAEDEAQHRRAEALRQAEWAEYRMEVARQDSKIEKEKKAREVKRRMSSAITRKGITPQGTPSLLSDDILTMGLYDMDLVDYETSKTIWGLTEEATGYRTEADWASWEGETESRLSRMRGSSAKDAARIKAGSILTGGIRSAAGTVYASGWRPSLSSNSGNYIPTTGSREGHAIGYKGYGL